MLKSTEDQGHQLLVASLELYPRVVNLLAGITGTLPTLGKQGFECKVFTESSDNGLQTFCQPLHSKYHPYSIYRVPD